MSARIAAIPIRTVSFTEPTGRKNKESVSENTPISDISESGNTIPAIVIPPRVPLSEGATYASKDDNFAPVIKDNKIGKLLLDFSAVDNSGVKADSLKMTVLNGAVLRTVDKVSSVTSNDRKILTVKLNKKNGIAKVKARKSGTGSVVFTMENGRSYTVSFTVEKPKAQKAAKRIKLSELSPENMVSMGVYDLFGTHIDAGVLDAKPKNRPELAYIKDNRLFINPNSKDKIKVIYKYLNKKYKMTINVG